MHVYVCMYVRGMYVCMWIARMKNNKDSDYKSNGNICIYMYVYMYVGMCVCMWIARKNNK